VHQVALLESPHLLDDLAGERELRVTDRELATQQQVFQCRLHVGADQDEAIRVRYCCYRGIPAGYNCEPLNLGYQRLSGGFVEAA
jgi:hypothetical protein